MTSKTRTLAVATTLVVAIVIVGVLAFNTVYSSASSKSVTRTNTVTMGTVQSTVTATGNVSPATSLTLNFSSSGIVTEVDVQPGTQVTAGQTLAKIDDTQTQAALSSAQASLASAQANLATMENPVTAAVAAQNASSLQSARQQVATAQANLTDARQNAAVNAPGYQNAVTQAQAQLTRDTAQYNADQAMCATTTTTVGVSGGTGGGTTAQSCATLLSQDQATVAKDTAAAANAEQAQTTGQLKDAQSVQQAQNALTTAQLNLASTQASNNAKTTSSPAAIASAQAQVTQAQANLTTAQKNEANTTLSAPIAGTVATVNGAPGQTVSGGGTSSASSSGGGSGSSSSGSSSAFITLDNVATLQVVAGFAEVDASKIGANQSATVTLNALPNQSISGTVTNVALNSTVVSNVVTYNVTITLTDPPSGAKPGMTANVSVTVGEAQDVLEVPNADVTTRAGASTVTLVRAGKQITQSVTIGLVGDQNTEIKSGVNAGDVVVAPRVNVSGGSTTGTGTGTGAGRGAGAGGFFVGGGGGGLGGGGGGGGGG